MATLGRKFTSNLKVLRQELGLSKSELARRIWGSVTDARGYEVARNRDRIGSWEAGKSTPTEDNLIRLAQALGVPVAQLAPDLVARTAPNPSTASVSLQSADGDPSRVILRVNVTIPAPAAFEIARLIHEASTSEG